MEPGGGSEMKVTFVLTDKNSLDFAINTGWVDPTRRSVTIDLTEDQMDKINKKDTEFISHLFKEDRR
jgi:hypothetical protein